MMRNFYPLYGTQTQGKAIVCGALAVLLTVVFGVSNAMAFVGEALGVDLNQVTCTNTTTGAMVPGDMLPGGVYDCDTVFTQIGDQVSVTLAGIATTGTANCLDVVENAASPPALALTEGACFNLIGTITVGFGDINNPTPGFEIDGFVFLNTVLDSQKFSSRLPRCRFAAGHPRLAS